MWVKFCTDPCWGRRFNVPHSDVRECDRAEVFNAIKESREQICFQMYTIACSGLLCGPIFWILWFLFFLSMFVLCVSPVLVAPVAFLLKLRQVAFVSTVYWTSWSRSEWFKFFGVVNNVIGLTAPQSALIQGHTRFLIENSMDAKYKVSDLNGVQRALKYLIRKSVYEKTESLIVTAMILNSWDVDPDRWMALLRGYTPEGTTEDAEP